MQVDKILRFKKEDLKEFVVKYFEKLDVPVKHAGILADVLIEADIRGVASHGLIRIKQYYGNRLEKGYMDKTTPYKVISETDTTYLIDGGNGLGHVVSYFAMNKVIEKAKKSNVAIAVVKRSDHYGIAGYYSMMALPHDMIGISLTNAQSLIAPTYGTAAMLGSNPISVACPSYKEYPFVLDMATCVVSSGKIKVYDKLGLKLPHGWIIDKDGNDSEDPNDLKDRVAGSILPLGGHDITSGYKGYGLAALVDIFCAILSGASVLTEVGYPDEDKVCDVSHFFMAINIEAFRPVIDFKKQMDHFIQSLRNSPKIKGKERIYVAGEKEFENAEYNNKYGVPVIERVVEDLKADGKRTGVPFNLKPLKNIKTLNY